MTNLIPITAETAARYSYYTVDIVSNKIVSQIPFEDVNYERILKGGGTFDGKISISDETSKLDLYNGTLPGKTALYVVRNDTCVWGGIIWGRTYDMVGRSLSISAQEFPSYFAHRNVWKTFNYSFSATATKTTSGGLTEINLIDRKLRKPLAATDSKGVKTKVYVSFSDGDLVKYSESYPIEIENPSTQTPTQSKFFLRIPKLPKSPNAREGVTISARVDTFEYIRELLNDVSIDFSDVDFQNEIIAPGVKTNNRITFRKCSNNTATLTTADPHYLVAGQRVEVKNLEKQLNGTFTVKEVPTPYEFKYDIPVLSVKSVYKDEADLATLKVHVPDGGVVNIKPGATINVSGCTNASFNGSFSVIQTTSDSISYSVDNPIGVATISLTTPGYINLVKHGLSINQKVYLTTTGVLPTGLAADATYYIVSTPTADMFSVSLTQGGAPIAFSGTQSGIHTLWTAGFIESTDTTGYIKVDDISVNATELNPTNYRINFRELTSTGKKKVTHVYRVDKYVTIYTKTRHGFKKGDKIVISIKASGDPAGSGSLDSLNTTTEAPTPAILSAGDYWFKYYDPNNSKNIYTSVGGEKKRYALPNGINRASLATPIKKRVLRTTDTSGFEDQDYVHIIGVDDYDWKTPIYNGYAEIDALDTESENITKRKRVSNVAILTTSDVHTFDVGDRVTISGMDDSAFNGEFLITDTEDQTFSFASIGSDVTEVSDAGTAVTYGGSWMQFEMPEYSVTNEPSNVASPSKFKIKKNTKTVIVTTSAAHGFRQGDVVTIAGSKINKNNAKEKIITGTFTITSVPQLDVFHYKIGKKQTVAYTDDNVKGSTATRTKSSTTSFPLDTLPIARVMRKTVGDTTRATLYIADHDLTEDTAITVIMGSPGESSFEGSGKPEKIADVLDNTFTYANSGAEVGKTTISQFSRDTKGVVTITTVEDHGYAAGQYVEISIKHATSAFGDKMNGAGAAWTIAKIVNSKSFTYATTTTKSVVSAQTAAANSTAYSTVAASAGSVLYVNYELFGSTREITTLACATISGKKYVTIGVVDHNYRVGDYIQLTLFGKTYQNYVYTTKDSKGALSPNLPVEIYSVSTNEITYVLPDNHTYLATMTDLAKVTDTSGMGDVGLAAQIEKTPVVVSRSYGEFPNNAALGGFDFSTTDYSDMQIQNSVLRGSDMTNVAQILEGYSNNTNGFDYRIDCSLTYDSLGNKMFKRTFVMVPITPTSYKDYLSGFSDKNLPVGTYAPPSAFGADRLLFEYPGNISNFNLSENSSSAATRVFVVGNNDDTGSGASARYAAASATNLLADGWPILDKAESQEWPLTGVNAINVDNWGNYDAEQDFHRSAERFLNESRPPLGDFIVSVNGSLNPVVGTYKPGDWCSLIINDDFFKKRLASILEPRKDVVVRKIDGIKVSVPNSPAFPEQIDLTLIAEWQVDAIGK